MQAHFRTRAVGLLSHGDHSSLLYSSVPEQLDVTRAFIQAAVSKNERVICVGDTEHIQRAASALGASGARALAKGQLLIENSAATYLRDGHFDASRMMQHYCGGLRDSLAQGYDGLRVAADMSWAAAVPESREDLVRYERALDAALEKQPAIVVCQYDRRLFTEEAVVALDAAHVSETRPDPLHKSLQLSIEREYDPHGLRVTGEIDISNRRIFRDELMRLADLSEASIMVDLSQVEYIDAASMTALANAALKSAPSTVRVRVSATLDRVFRTAWPMLPDSLILEQVP